MPQASRRLLLQYQRHAACYSEDSQKVNFSVADSRRQVFTFKLDALATVVIVVEVEPSSTFYNSRRLNYNNYNSRSHIVVIVVIQSAITSYNRYNYIVSCNSIGNDRRLL